MRRIRARFKAPALPPTRVLGRKRPSCHRGRSTVDLFFFLCVAAYGQGANNTSGLPHADGIVGEASPGRPEWRGYAFGDRTACAAEACGGLRVRSCQPARAGVTTARAAKAHGPPVWENSGASSTPSCCCPKLRAAVFHFIGLVTTQTKYVP